MPDFSASWRHALSLATTALLGMTLLVSQAAAEGEVNIYSYREPGLINPLLDAFTKETGIETNVVFAPSGLIERLTAEGANSPADLLLANESGLLLQARDAGVTQAVHSDVLKHAIPASLRDPDGHWFGLTRRARVVYASKERTELTSITYMELADPRWRNRICIRSGQHTYNIALIASMIAHHGAKQTETWLTGLRENLARKPSGGDREAVRDVDAGLCDLAIGNTYYMAQMLKHPKQQAWADAVRMIFPDASGRGTHVNVSGVSLTAGAPNRENALKLMEYLVSPQAQRLYAEANGEYPVVDGVAASPLVASWGKLHADPLPLTKIAEFRKQASELVDRVQFDQGPNF
jgi:iron(III) transport system substrate-binding protein